MSYFIYTDLISSLLDPRLVDPGSTLIPVDAYDHVNDCLCIVFFLVSSVALKMSLLFCILK